MHHVMGVCCIVFDIDGMLFDFFMNFLNIEKNKILRFFFSIFHVFFAFLCYFQHLKKQALVGTGMSRARNSRWGMLLHVNEARIYGGKNKKGVHVYHVGIAIYA